MSMINLSLLIGVLTNVAFYFANLQFSRNIDNCVINKLMSLIHGRSKIGPISCYWIFPNMSQIITILLSGFYELNKQFWTSHKNPLQPNNMEKGVVTKNPTKGKKNP